MAAPSRALSVSRAVDVRCTEKCIYSREKERVLFSAS